MNGGTGEDTVSDKNEWKGLSRNIFDYLENEILEEAISLYRGMTWPEKMVSEKGRRRVSSKDRRKSGVNRDMFYRGAC